MQRGNFHLLMQQLHTLESARQISVLQAIWKLRRFCYPGRLPVISNTPRSALKSRATCRRKLQFLLLRRMQMLLTWLRNIHIWPPKFSCLPLGLLVAHLFERRMTRSHRTGPTRIPKSKAQTGAIANEAAGSLLKPVKPEAGSQRHTQRRHTLLPKRRVTTGL
ncbi:hypothetical protein BDN67DRAFT_235913 [Paxillus ammoniavirescens]|nr:hypothetical protein BDN67DRAFT_235913 [Paxillus ammoniavirescens]